MAKKKKATKKKATKKRATKKRSYRPYPLTEKPFVKPPAKEPAPPGFQPGADYTGPARCVLVRCDDCDWTDNISFASEVSDADARLCAGAEVPAGQCPQCGALAYLQARPKWLPPYFNREEVDRMSQRADAYLRQIRPVQKEEHTLAAGRAIDRAFQRGLAAGAHSSLELVLTAHNCSTFLKAHQAAALEEFLAVLREEDSDKSRVGSQDGPSAYAGPS